MLYSIIVLHEHVESQINELVWYTHISVHVDCRQHVLQFKYLNASLYQNMVYISLWCIKRDLPLSQTPALSLWPKIFNSVARIQHTTLVGPSRTTKKRHIHDILGRTNFFLSYIWHFYDDNCDKTRYHHRCGGLLLLWQKIMTENGPFVLDGPETQLHDILWAVHDGKNRGRSEGRKISGSSRLWWEVGGRAMCVSLVHVWTCVRGVGSNWTRARHWALTEPERLHCRLRVTEPEWSIDGC